MRSFINPQSIKIIFIPIRLLSDAVQERLSDSKDVRLRAVNDTYCVLLNKPSNYVRMCDCASSIESVYK